jgi:hypothetical protein
VTGRQAFWWGFWGALWRHRKRGNTAIPPLGLRRSWMMGQCCRYIITGNPRHAPRSFRRIFKCAA